MSQNLDFYVSEPEIFSQTPFIQKKYTAHIFILLAEIHLDYYHPLQKGKGRLIFLEHCRDHFPKKTWLCGDLMLCGDKSLILRGKDADLHVCVLC